MTPREHMERYARRVPGGGIAWERTLFTACCTTTVIHRIDAAVDIAWDRLLIPEKTMQTGLVITEQGRLLTIRRAADAIDSKLPVAA